MTREVSCCPPDATVERVAQLMSDLNVGTVPITEGDRLIGMVTDRDIAVRVVARGVDPRSEKIAGYVTRDVATITPDTSIDGALRLMEARQVRRLPVVDGGRLVGIVSLGDFATKAPKPTGPRERLVGEALEEISRPAHPQRARAGAWRGVGTPGASVRGRGEFAPAVRRTGESWMEDLLEVAHTLGAATWFGGQLFAAAGLHPAVEVLADPGERAKIIDEAWRRFRPYTNAGLGLVGLVGAIWALRPSDQPPRQLKGLANFSLLCTGGALTAAAASGYFGKRIAEATPGGRTPVETATRPAPETPRPVAQTQRWLAVSEALALAFGVGLLVSSALLAKQTGGGEGAWGGGQERGMQPGFPARLAA